jgi:hypothetical protein
MRSYPLITLSTRAQVESKKAHSSTLSAARNIIRREGVAGLYSGLESALFGISVTNFVYYYCVCPSICPPEDVSANLHQGTSGPEQRLRRLQSRLAGLPNDLQQ